MADAAAASPHPSRPHSHFVSLPDAVLFSCIGRLLGTHSVVGSLGRTHSPLHAASRHPDMHIVLCINSTKPIHLSSRQVGAWAHTVSQTHHAVLNCPVTDGLVLLIEATRKSLVVLEADSVCHVSWPSGDVKGLLVFPRLRRVALGGAWLPVGEHRQWASRPREVCLRDRKRHQICGDSFAEDTRLVWVTGSRSLEAITLIDKFGSPKGWGGAAVRQLLRTPFPQTALRALKGVSLDEPSSQLASVLAANGVKLSELSMAITVAELDTDMVKAVHTIRARCLAVGAREDWSKSSFVFPISLMWAFSSVELRLYEPTLIFLAAIAKKAVFPTGLAIAEHPTGFLPLYIYRHMIKLSFFKVTCLAMEDGDDEFLAEHIALPDELLSELPRLFRHVTCLDVGRGLHTNMGTGAVRKAIESLPKLTEIRHTDPDPDVCLLPSCLLDCGSHGTPLHIKGRFGRDPYHPFYAPWMLWGLWDSAPDPPAIAPDQGGIRSRIQRISVEMRMAYDEADVCDMSDSEIGEEISYAHATFSCPLSISQAIEQLPSLERIVVECPDFSESGVTARVWMDVMFDKGLNEGKRTLRHVLHSHGWQVWYAETKVEFCRRLRGQRPITDFFPRL
ncbi:unnamed protein product [Vitrella brassicaformis CCMP3155]|uniref:Uncharacterized protein n=1 Tax=Vitrella brassicaformis (strain CCMP3155) TaxID=1169540 RepID=A0A0G4ETS8_VITBC|nr:unnamed protein product [Vitrella brassicaformis CCMP3155]|mmetsp:Transcript_32994/g.95193  ORF Transcript_32994/g.95193 Transcript_32994/m.95193 type:complete len:618 (+) Transcript_32994:160-2013(+)|eukprot:CEM02032.1 unnamed protein product [Vitrella brassicaformis CCMP3155]